VKHFYHHLIQTFNTFLITLLIVLGLQFCYFYYVQQIVEKQAHRWLDLTLLDLLTEWDESKFLTLSSSNLIENMTVEQHDNTKQIFQKLNQLLQYHGSDGQIVQYGLFFQTTQIRYQAQASFKHGALFAIITLVKEAEQWKIEQFYYEYAFYPQQKQQGSLQPI